MSGRHLNASLCVKITDQKIQQSLSSPYFKLNAAFELYPLTCRFRSFTGIETTVYELTCLMYLHPYFHIKVQIDTKEFL